MTDRVPVKGNSVGSNVVPSLVAKT